MMHLFTSYIHPIIEYAVPLWAPTDVGFSVKFKLMQRRFTKRVRGLHNLSNEERLLRSKIPLISCSNAF